MAWDSGSFWLPLSFVMPDLLPPSLVEMLAEMERDLLARRRVYHNRLFTRRLTHERAERRLLIVQAIIDNLTTQLTPGQIEARAKAAEKKARLREARAKAKKEAAE